MQYTPFAFFLTVGISKIVKKMQMLIKSVKNANGVYVLIAQCY